MANELYWEKTLGFCPGYCIHFFYPGSKWVLFKFIPQHYDKLYKLWTLQGHLRRLETESVQFTAKPRICLYIITYTSSKQVINASQEDGSGVQEVRGGKDCILRSYSRLWRECPSHKAHIYFLPFDNWTQLWWNWFESSELYEMETCPVCVVCFLVSGVPREEGKPL